MVPASAGMAYTPEQMLMQESGMLPHYGAGGKIAGMVEHFLPLAEREANKAKFLEPSAVKHRLYHGTTSDISAFDPKTATNKTGNVTSHFGTFLSDNPAEASRYAQQWGTTGGNVMPVYAQLQNPYMMPYKEMDKYAMGAWNRRMAEPDYDPKSVVKVGDMDAQRKSAEAIEKHTQAAIQDVLNRKQELIELGHDGIIAEIGGNREIIPFKPTQIKSATGNQGTYNINNPDINHAKGGRIDNLSPADMEAALIYNNHTPPKFQYATGGPVHMAEGKQVDKTGKGIGALFASMGLKEAYDAFKEGKIGEGVTNLGTAAAGLLPLSHKVSGSIFSVPEVYHAYEAYKHGKPAEALENLSGVPFNFMSLPANAAAHLVLHNEEAGAPQVYQYPERPGHITENSLSNFPQQTIDYARQKGALGSYGLQ